jgi:hypothetical protein
MRRSIDRRLKRLEGRFVPAVKPPHIKIRFINPDGTEAGTLLMRGDQKILDPPEIDGHTSPTVESRGSCFHLSNQKRGIDTVRGPERPPIRPGTEPNPQTSINGQNYE